MIESAVEVTAYSLRTSDIEVSFRLARNLPTVMGDPDQLRQVFTNLILNAKNALEDVEGPRKLRITSFHRKGTEQVTVKVKDNGPGVPAEINLDVVGRSEFAGRELVQQRGKWMHVAVVELPSWI